MRRVDELVARLEELFAAIDAFDEPMRSIVLEFLDGVDDLHRLAVQRWASQLDERSHARLREAEPAVAWLLEAYGVPEPDAGGSEIPVVLRPSRVDSEP